MKYKLYWHEPSNSLAIFDLSDGDLPLVNIVDEEYKGVNPFYTYSVLFMPAFGWIDLGELK